MRIKDKSERYTSLQSLQKDKLDVGFWFVQYEAQIEAIVEQAQHVGQPNEGLWCCTIV